MNAPQIQQVLPEARVVTQLADMARDAGLLLCHWKSNNRLQLAVRGGDDLDLSIPPAQEAALGDILQQLGFLEFRPRPWQRFHGVKDWLGLEPGSGALLHVHLHTRLVTGADGVMEQDLPWLDVMNRALQIDPATRLCTPPPAFDAHVLLAREAIKTLNLRGRLMTLLGRDPVSPDAHQEMTWLLEQCTQRDLDLWGSRLWGTERWMLMKLDFRDGRLWTAPAFRRLRVEVATALRPHRRGTWVARDVTFLAMRGAKYLHSLQSWATGTTVSGKHLMGARAPIIAVVGSDGAGKSTVTSDLEKWLAKKADVTTVYFGTNHSWFRRLRGTVLQLLPGFQPKAIHINQPDRIQAKRSSFPLWLQAAKWAFMARIRLHFLRKARRLSRAGTIVLADRYPQAEVHGTYDGPSRLGQCGLGPVGLTLQRLEHRSFAKMREVRPDLVIKLIAPLEIALARKTDHDPASLAERIRITRILNFNYAPIVEIDASQPLNEVIRQARRHVWTTMRAVNEDQGALH